LKRRRRRSFYSWIGRQNKSYWLEKRLHLFERSFLTCLRRLAHLLWLFWRSIYYEFWSLISGTLLLKDYAL